MFQAKKAHRLIKRMINLPTTNLKRLSDHVLAHLKTLATKWSQPKEYKILIVELKSVAKCQSEKLTKTSSLKIPPEKSRTP